jgi:hypothetical protein
MDQAKSALKTFFGPFVDKRGGRCVTVARNVSRHGRCETITNTTSISDSNHSSNKAIENTSIPTLKLTPGHFSAGNGVVILSLYSRYSTQPPIKIGFFPWQSLILDGKISPNNS